MKKILRIVILLMILLLVLTNNSYSTTEYIIDDTVEIAAIPTEQGSSGGLIDVNAVLNEVQVESSETYLKNRAKTITTVIRNIGIVVSVISLMIIGIKFMVSSAEERAGYMKALPGYLLGVFMVAAMTMIPSLIYDIINEL